LSANLARLGLTAQVVVADAAVWRPEVPLDAVLLDAPCSATGTLRRHPDVAWLKRPADLPKLCATQDRLLAAAVEMLAPGGLLVYCTCSLQAEEGAQRVDALLAAGAPFRRRPIDAAELDGAMEWITAAGDLRSLPCHLAEKGGMDAFYAARLERL
jgi:16S rRNA (cytosine967-C5)-methyltransferase